VTIGSKDAGVGEGALAPQAASSVTLASAALSSAYRFSLTFMADDIPKERRPLVWQANS
jgi:hypothetical protein